MKRIERNMKVIAATGAIMFATLAGGLFLVQQELSRSQSGLADVVVPVQRSLGELAGAVSRFFLRQAGVVQARSTELGALGDRSSQERALRLADEELRLLLTTPTLMSEPGYPSATVAELQEGVSDLILSDTELFSAVRGMRQCEDELATKLKSLYAELAGLTECAASLADVLRLAYVSELHAIAALLSTGEAPIARVSELLLGDVRAELDAIDALEEGVLRLGIVIGKVGHAPTSDALDALVANELAHNRAQIMSAALQIEALVTDPDLAAEAHELGAMGAALTDLIHDPLVVGAESLVFARREVLGKRARVREIQATAARFANALIERTYVIRSFASQLAQDGEASAASTIDSTRLVTILVTLIGLVLGVGSARRVRSSIVDLRQRNIQLARLSDDLARANGSLETLNQDLEGRVAERTASLSTANLVLAREMEARARVEVELRQAQKLEAVGRLAAGVAHEINTPVQFVGDSATFARDAAVDVLAVLATYRTLVAELADGKRTVEEVKRLTSDLEADKDLDYIESQLAPSLDRVIEGVERVAGIVRAMKEFSHPGRQDKVAADINQAIRSTLVVAANEYKYVADVHTALGSLPSVMCHLGELNQVILNLIVNAAHAVEDRVAQSGGRGLITIASRLDGDAVEIAVGDTGSGIPDAVSARIFEPFFTTKEVGRGTGQGLAIARSVVVDKHGGTLTFDTRPGVGTTFFIRIPNGDDAPILQAA